MKWGCFAEDRKTALRPELREIIAIRRSARFVVSKRREEWQQDINARQRNTVFPDTAQNEGRLWRNLASGRQKLTIVQGIAIALIVFTIVSIEWRQAVRTFRFGTSGPTFGRLIAIFLNLAIPLGLFGIFLLVLRWAVRRELLSKKRPS